VRTPGEYRVTPAEIDIYLHEFADFHLRPVPARLALDQGRVTKVLSISGGDELFPAYLEPQLISGLRGASRQVREWVSYDDLPARFLDVLLAIEDRRFFSHPGIDPIAVGRAVWTNVTRGTVIQGGSTITQQLAKNLFYSPQRTFGRKLKESIAALVLEAKYRKQAILESYANEIYLGQVGSVSIYGVGEAAHRYFGKRVDALSLEETALLVGMIKGPNTYSPLRNPALAKQRRDVVLGRLHEQGLVSDDAWKQAVMTPRPGHAAAGHLGRCAVFCRPSVETGGRDDRGALAGRCQGLHDARPLCCNGWPLRRWRVNWVNWKRPIRR
jgi:hypothetical protein